jgi:hypothetical protein
MRGLRAQVMQEVKRMKVFFFLPQINFSVLEFVILEVFMKIDGKMFVFKLNFINEDIRKRD